MTDYVIGKYCGHINTQCCIRANYDETFLDCILQFGLKHLQQ